MRIVIAAIVLIAQVASADISPDARKKIFDKASPSLVIVQFVWDSELGRRELAGAGVIVNGDGLVMTSIALFHAQFPDEQLKEFKVIVPRENEDNEELDAIFLGRDERSNVGFVRTKEKQKWTPLTFEQAPICIGENVISVGLLPKNGGYRAYLAQSMISASLRGEVTMFLTMGGLSAISSPVFNADGKAIGFVNQQPNQQPFLNIPNPENELGSITTPPVFFVPTKDFAQSLADPPSAPGALKLPWMGIPQGAMSGLNKDVAEALGLKNQPAVEVGGVIPNSPADKAGLKSKDIIVKLNGQPLERGDEPEDLPSILTRTIRRMKIGEAATLSVITAKGQTPRDVKVVLAERPKTSNLAARFWAEDLGFSVREVVFSDTYVRKLAADAKGVIVGPIKRGSSAANAKLQPEDMVVEMNGSPVTDLAQFKKDYEQVRKDKPREALVLVVIRQGATQTIRIEPPQ